MEGQDKPNKLFISHSSKDKKYVEALAEMLKSIGMPDGSFICTSVPGYGIPGGAKIYGWLREQFQNYNLRVLYVLSKNYYESPACLNEMGAAWMTRATDTLLLLPGFHFSDIDGCIDPTEMGISFEADDDEIRHRLNELKETLAREYGLPEIREINWEKCRNRFISAVHDAAKANAPRFAGANAEDAGMGFRQRYEPKVGMDDINYVPLDSAFLLVYAAAANSDILKMQTLGSPTQVTAGGYCFMADDSQRESARWVEALDWLVSQNWVKSAGYKGEAYRLTGTGYKMADMLKDRMEIDTNVDPLIELKEFE